MWKENLMSDGQTFHQYQQNKQINSDGQTFHQYQQNKQINSNGQKFHQYQQSKQLIFFLAYIIFKNSALDNDDFHQC